jgi:putative FmdB family regulatory protein
MAQPACVPGSAPGRVAAKGNYMKGASPERNHAPDRALCGPGGPSSGSVGRNTMGFVPIYEYRCEVCGERFERLVPAGTEEADCPVCGAERARRVMSRPATPMRLVKTPRQKRRMEDKRGIAREGSKQRFKESRRREREARAGRQRGGSG